MKCQNKKVQNMGMGTYFSFCYSCKNSAMPNNICIWINKNIKLWDNNIKMIYKKNNLNKIKIY